MKVVYRPAALADLDGLLPRLRQADIDECEALSGPGSLLAMAYGTFLGSTMAWSAEVDGRVEAMFGVSGRLFDGVGHPWMFGTDEVDRHVRSLVITSKDYISTMLELFPRLENVVDARNTKSVRWLKRMGFTLSEPVATGAAGLPFHPFYMGG